MSRRVDASRQATQAQRNQQTLKSLLKLEPNKVCADCKIHKHPRWASWNLGVFFCIRCSGIHRGMGTHISRVKSVDLDSWTDEQLQSMLNWGNARANKYWEAKLAPGHRPSDSKIESFIRTKYELKRWVMDGPMPDPSTLDDDDNIPLSLVKEKNTIERKESIRKASIGQSARPSGGPLAPPPADLIGGDPLPQRASTTSPPAPKMASKAAAAPPKATGGKDSLLGLDFFGDQSAAPPRPSSTTATPGSGGSSRPDLKQSILSLYATAPRPQTQQPQQPQSSTQAFGEFASQAPQQTQSASAGLADAFGGLNFGNAPAAPAKPADPFASLASPATSAKSPASNNSFGGLSGGGFFDAKPAPALHQQQSSTSSGSLAGLGSLTSPTNNIPPSKPVQSSSSAMDDLFDFGAPAPSAPKPTSPTPQASQPSSSVFNLSSNVPKAPAAPAVAAPVVAPASSGGGWGGNDVWGNAWGASDPVAPAATSAPTPKPASTSTTNDFGWGSSNAASSSIPAPSLASGGSGSWGSPNAGSGSFASQSIVPGASGGFSAAPQVSADEEFGGWTSGAGTSTSGAGAGSGTASKPAGGFGTNEDLFSNVWQ
ncbi:related to zinc finger protein Gcs1p [Cephalotrichum gorgonifer]|uniref:Related to zinc finger protein Gcs1p n=1 Tax=Cephalotrichum gorgonifer TaxID=2041049 RepID=A0AAE8N229_9PEZI|nr:related to zinc finger protein Gcs1p [Cephalotrichum gorgonifer]